MALSNQQLAAIFADIGGRLEIEGTESVFVTRAYTRAAETIEGSARPMAEIYAEGGLKGLEAMSGIGKEIAKKIESLLQTGQLEFFDKVRVRVPDGVAAMLQVPTVGPKRVKQFWQELQILSVDELEAAAAAGKLRDLPRLGEKAEQKILAGIASMKRRATGRLRVGDVLPLALEICDMLQKLPEVQKIEYAGSLRRMKETIGDLDFVVATTNGEPVMQTFWAMPNIEEILGAGNTKSSVRLNTGLQVDLRTVEPKHWGCAMQYFTGSQQHNIRVREIAQQQGFSLNEYALTHDKTGEQLFFDTETALYNKLGLAYIEPELREDRGEIPAAQSKPPKLPKLIELKDMRGDLQMHTTWSDGATDVMGMAEAAIELGYEYILITDHTAGLGIVNGLTPERIRQQRVEIDRVNAELKQRKARLTVLHGAEVEVKSDGALDLPDDVLAELDLVQASVHTSLTQPREKITARAIAAMRNPHIDILGHPSGRIINEREGADYDWDALFRAAVQYGVAVEINADTSRLDLSDVHARRAMELGCKITISTDAHTPLSLPNMRLGVGVARRAWITAESVVNTWPLAQVLKWTRNKAL